MQNETYIWNWLKSHSPLNDYAIAGIMANMQGESAGLANNLEDRVNTLLGVTDEEYTRRVDNGTYSREFFATENGAYGGYGLCQWTEKTRSRNLYDFAKSKGVSIGNMDMQLEFMLQEMQTQFKTCWQKLMTANNLMSPTASVCEDYEIPANAQAQSKVRYGYAEGIYARNHKEETAVQTDTTTVTNMLLDVIANLEEQITKLKKAVEEI